MFEAIGYFLFGLFLLLLGGDSVVRGASGLAQRLGLSPFLAGLLLVSFATSLPELAVNGYALRHGQVELALGNAIGSNIVNISLTLALAAIAAPLLVNMRILAAEVVFIVVATGVVLFFALDGAISRGEGALLLLGFVGVLFFVFKRGRDEPDDVRLELEKYAHTGTALMQNLARLVIGAVVLYFGSRQIVVNAPTLGQAWRLSALTSGMTVVAVGTALPELTTALLAARQGQGNVVAGQVLGSCLFNLLVIIGGMAVIEPLAMPASLVGIALPVAMAFGLVLYPVITGASRMGRRSGGLLLALCMAWLLYALAPAWR